MPLGKRALDPTTPYFVYEFVFDDKVFYVGHTYHDVRAHGRWVHVTNLVRHEEHGTFKPDKRQDLYTLNNPRKISRDRFQVRTGPASCCNVKKLGGRFNRLLHH
jgi:hypothetical protein